MDFKKPRDKPEAKIAKGIVNVLISKGWTPFKVGAGKYVSGWPDFYCYHKIHGHRWIETKVKYGSLTPQQIERFSKLTRAGDNVYILNDACEYGLLFRGSGNWTEYLKI